ncbi:MAG: hypothetical protein Q9208_004160 [Pyrenodesmia sp. 3 TL-2023]
MSSSTTSKPHLTPTASFRSTYLFHRFIRSCMMAKSQSEAYAKSNQIINDDAKKVLALCALLEERCVTGDGIDVEPRLRWKQELYGLRCRLCEVALPALCAVQKEFVERSLRGV